MPNKSTPIPTKLSAILVQTKNALISSLELGQEKVLISADEPPLFNSQAEQYVVIQPQGGVIEQPIWIGSGKVEIRQKRQVFVRLRTRVAQDESDRDEIRLTDSALGHYDMEHALFVALAGFIPQDSQKNWLVYEPFMPVSVGGVGRTKMDPAWVESIVSVSADYIMFVPKVYDDAGNLVIDQG